MLLRRQCPSDVNAPQRAMPLRGQCPGEAFQPRSLTKNPGKTRQPGNCCRAATKSNSTSYASAASPRRAIFRWPVSSGQVFAFDFFTSRSDSSTSHSLSICNRMFMLHELLGRFPPHAVLLFEVEASQLRSTSHCCGAATKSNSTIY
jgi:hypothetical protein